MRLGVVLTLLASLVPATAAAQQTHILVVTGLGGDTEYRQQFHSWATTLIAAATTRYEVPAGNVI